MKIFREARGKFKAVIGYAKTDSMIRVEGLKGLANGTFVENFNVTKAEKKAIVQCFGGMNHVYAFGHDPEGSNYSVTFYSFLDNNCYEGTEPRSGVEDLLTFYRKKRVSESKKLVSMTIGRQTVSGILTGLQLVGVDPTLNLAAGTLVFTDVNP